MSWSYWADFIPLEEAVEVSGADIESLKRLLHKGIIRGNKKVIAGRLRWMADKHSLRKYFDKNCGFALDLPGPKLYLSRQGGRAETGAQYWVTSHNYDHPTYEEEYTQQQQTIEAGSFHEAAQALRHLFGRNAKVLVVRIEQRPLVLVDEE